MSDFNPGGGSPHSIHNIATEYQAKKSPASRGFLLPMSVRFGSNADADKKPGLESVQLLCSALVTRIR